MAEIDAPDERDLVAAEYALGLLDESEWAAADARYARDADFAGEVRRWRQRLSPLYREVVEEDVPPALWARVEAGTRPRAASPRRGLAVWRAGAIVATALAATLAAVLLLRPAQVAPPAAPRVVTRVVTRVVETPPRVVTRVVEAPPRVVEAPPRAVTQAVQAPSAPATFAQLVQPDGKATVVARYDAAAARIYVQASDLPQRGGTPELWVIAQGGAPRSLGLIDRAGSRTLTVAPALRPLLRAGATLAVTLEDAATAPHRAPSGDILVSGTIAQL